MNITYRQNGDYLIPNIIIRKTKPLGHYGRLRKAYLEMHRPILFNELVLSDKLFEHCAEIDEAARSRMELIVPELAKATRSEVVQVIGTKFVLYRESHSKPREKRIQLVKPSKKRQA